MFTGLVEAVGRLKRIRTVAGGASFEIESPVWDADLKDGDSVAVQGACLTVTSHTDGMFCCDVLEETLMRTNLGDKSVGAALNLERAMKLGDRIGGHLVSGHVDALGKIRDISFAGRDRVVAIECSPDILPGIVEKGSVALDGISLTVSGVSVDAFEVNIIPFTWSHTSLAERRVGDSLNIETDMLGKYVQRYLEGTARKGGVDISSLAAAGFLAVDTP